MWLITITYTGGQGAGAILTAALSFATFTIIVGLGQMMVITTGPGNVDLSIPATITLSGVVAMKVMDEQSARLLLGIAAALGARRPRRHLQLCADPTAAHSAHHRDPVIELPHPVDGHFLWPRHPHQAAANRWPTSPPRGILGVPLDGIPGARYQHRHGRRPQAHALRPQRAGHRPEHARRMARRAERRPHALRHLCAERLTGRGLRHPALGLLGRRGPQHGRGIPARLHCRRRHRRHLGGRWPRQCAGHMGRGALHVSAGHHAQHAGCHRAGIRLILTGLLIIAVIVIAGGEEQR